MTVVAGLVLLGGALPVGPNAHASVPTPTNEGVFVDDDQISLTPDEEFWEMTIRVDSAYIATWERSDGIWESVDEAKAAIRARNDCIVAATLEAMGRFASYREFTASELVEPTEDGTLKWVQGTDVTTSLVTCRAESEWSWVGENHALAEDGQTVRIPLTQIGPGDHDIFVLLLRDVDCARKVWPDGSSLTLTCLVPSHVDVTTVTVPDPEADASDDRATTQADEYDPQPAFWALGGLVALAAIVTTVVIALRRRRSTRHVTEDEPESTNRTGRSA